MQTIIDQIGSELNVPFEPKRIVSLVPSITETLCDLGLLSLLVGVTKFCVHPKEISKQTLVIGGTKNPRISDIIASKPDIVFANKEENRLEDIQAIRAHDIHVYTTDISNIPDTIHWLIDLQKIFSSYRSISSLCQKLEELMMHDVKPIPIRSLYLIWKNPLMTIGHDTFIHHMLSRYGFQNVFGHQQRYPEVTVKEINEIKPQFILLSSEPYPFHNVDLLEFEKKFPRSKCLIVDGEMFSWYGSRILLADRYLNTLKDSLSMPNDEKT